MSVKKLTAVSITPMCPVKYSEDIYHHYCQLLLLISLCFVPPLEPLDEI